MLVSEKQQFKMIVWTLMVIMTFSVCLGISMLEPPHLYRHRIAAAQARIVQGVTPSRSDSRLPASIGARLTTIQDSAAGRKVSNDRLHRVGEDDFFPDLAIETFDVVLPCLTERASQSAVLEGSRAFVPQTVKQVRIRASQCDVGSDWSEMEISNISNGFKSTVFEAAPGAWLTDYISLTKESSVIRVAFSNQNDDNQFRDFVIAHAPDLED